MSLSLTSEKTVLGLISHPIKHSYSPFIHNRAAEILGIDMVYLPFDVPFTNLKDAMRGVVALNIKGFNVSLPHKENILTFLNEISEEASIISSVNTVVNDIGKLIGYNTDSFGVLDSLQDYKDLIKGNEVAIVGSGGSARAVIYTLIRHFKPEGIHIINRTEQFAETLKKYFKTSMNFEKIRAYELFPPDLVPVLTNCSVIINTTPLGMFPDTDDCFTDIAESFVPGQLYFDLVYNPLETKQMIIAKERGAITLGGLKMLVAQAAKSFELFTGKEMPSEQIFRELTESLKK
ncbi:MAG: shikimate dehydrogenase [Ignavibacteriaceae bacterium]|nr:shikimate dehydrogenase [Ignavibacteriaceae bacterium]